MSGDKDVHIGDGFLVRSLYYKFPARRTTYSKYSKPSMLASFSTLLKKCDHCSAIDVNCNLMGAKVFLEI